MDRPWKAAERTMVAYYATKGQEWPGHEAQAILDSVKVGVDRRWTDQSRLDWAETVLARSLFDVHDLASNHLGITIGIDSLEYLDEGVGAPVYGCAYPDSAEMVVCERTLSYKPLYRTTVVHEVGHVLLHKDTHNRCLLYTPLGAPPGTEEYEANQFMQTAILPKPVLCLGVAYLCHIWRIDLRLAFGAANTERGRWIWRYRLFKPLINLLCVSREMICIKLRRIGCISEDTLRFHKKYALETLWRKPEPCPSTYHAVRNVLADLQKHARSQRGP